MSAKPYANIAVRLPEGLLSALDVEKETRQVRSLSRVVELLLAEQIASSSLPHVRLQPNVKRRVFSIRSETAERLRDIATEHATDIGSLVFSILDSGAPVVSSRRQSEALRFEAIAA